MLETISRTVMGFGGLFLGGQPVSQVFGGEAFSTPLKELHGSRKAENIR